MLQVRKNLITNIICLVVNVFVGILYTPYLVRSLGATAYGVIPLALLINQYIGILTESLTGAVTRFYSIEYRQNKFKEASTYFTSAILFTIILAILLLPVIYILVDNLNQFLSIPEELITSAKMLFNLTALSFFMAVVSNCINVTIFADNRLDLVNCVKIARNIFKLIINIVLFIQIGVDIANVGLSYVIAESIVLLLSILFYRITKHNAIQFSFKHFDTKVFKPIFGMIFWVSIICLANTFIYKIDSVLLTNYFGLYFTGVVGSLAEFGSYCISITAVIGAVFRPLILISYSENKHNEVKELTLAGAHVVGILSCALCGVVIGFSKPLLSLWLSDEFVVYSTWLIIKMLVIPFISIGGIYSMVYNFWNQVKKPAIISVLIALVNVIVSIMLLEIGINITMLLVINAFFMVLQGFLMNSYMLISIYGDLKKVAVKSIIRISLYFIFVIVFSIFIATHINCDNIIKLLIACLLVGVISIGFSLLFIDKLESKVLNMILPIDKILHRDKK